MTKTTTNNQHPVAVAVAPLKVDAQNKAAEIARDVVARAVAKLEAAGWNLDTVAPYPRNAYAHDYKAAKARRAFFSSIAAHDADGCHAAAEAAGVVPYSVGAPAIVKRDEAKESRFVAGERDAAGRSFDSYVAKLCGKVGACDAATVSGLLW